MVRDWWQEEWAAWAEGYACVVGIDEAGRGPLAGPVVAACVCLPFGWTPPGLNDSKKLTAAQREAVLAHIQERARGIGVGVVEAAEIDTLNILRATHEAMRRALNGLPPHLQPDIALIDGLPVRPFPVDQIALVGGDGRSASVAAASIVAKVTRDWRMVELAALYPGYGFAGHKGYPSTSHLQALDELGPCEEHRRSFAPVRDVLVRRGEMEPPPPKSTRRPRKRATDAG